MNRCVIHGRSTIVFGLDDADSPADADMPLSTEIAPRTGTVYTVQRKDAVAACSRSAAARRCCHGFGYRSNGSFRFIA